MFRTIDVGKTKLRLVLQGFFLTLLIPLAFWIIAVVISIEVFPAGSGFRKFQKAKNSYQKSLGSWSREGKIRNFLGIGNEETPQNVITSSRAVGKTLREWLVKTSLVGLPFILFLSFFPLRAIFRIERRKMKGLSRGMKRKDGAKIKERGRIEIVSGNGEANFRIPYKLENRGILICGTQGTGKTVMLNYFLSSLLNERKKPSPEHQEKIILHDFNQDYTGALADRDDVTLLSFADKRRVKWNIFSDLFSSISLRREIELSAIANCLIPTTTQKDKVWEEGARQILTGLLIVLLAEAERENRTINNSDMKKMLGIPAEDVYRKMMEVVEARPYTQRLLEIEKGNRTAVSFWQTFHEATLNIFSLLDDEGDFSLRKDFLNNPKKKILILQNIPAISEAVSPLITLAFHLLSLELLTRENPDYYTERKLDGLRKREYWFILDEMAQLGRIPSLAKLPETGRNKGIALVICSQGKGTLRERYSEETVNSIFNNSNTLVSFRLNSPREFKEMAEAFGESETKKFTETQSLGTTRYSDRLTLQERTEVEKIVTPSEILNLGDLAYFSRIAEHPVSRYTEKRFMFPQVADTFVPDESFKEGKFHFEEYKEKQKIKQEEKKKLKESHVGERENRQDRPWQFGK